jgi:hypothetical protein
VRRSQYQAPAAQAVASSTWNHEYMPCAPSGRQITEIQVEKAAISAMARGDCASADITASGQV